MPALTARVSTVIFPQHHHIFILALRSISPVPAGLVLSNFHGPIPYGIWPGGTFCGSLPRAKSRIDTEDSISGFVGSRDVWACVSGLPAYWIPQETSPSRNPVHRLLSRRCDLCYCVRPLCAVFRFCRHLPLECGIGQSLFQILQTPPLRGVSWTVFVQILQTPLLGV